MSIKIQLLNQITHKILDKSIYSLVMLEALVAHYSLINRFV